MNRILDRLYLASDKVSAALGTPWATLLLAALAVVGTPGLAPPEIQAAAFWLAVSFVQLVALPILQTGQNRSSARLEALVNDTHSIVVDELAEIKAIAAELRKPPTTH